MYIGLRRTVLYMRELGYVFADDGLRMYRIEEADFDKLCPVDVVPDTADGASSGNSTSSETSKEDLLRRFPSLFQTCASLEEAEVSFREQEY